MIRIARMNIKGFAPAVPAKMKLAFMNAPKKAANPVKRPTISPFDNEASSIVEPASKRSQC